MYIYVNYKSNWNTIIGLEKNYCPHGLHRRTPSSSHHTLTKPKWGESYTDGVISYLDEIVFESSTTILCTQHNKLISYRFHKAENFQTCESLVAPKNHGNFNFGKIFLSLDIFKSPSTLLVLFCPVFLIVNSFCSTFFETFTFLIRKHKVCKHFQNRAPCWTVSKLATPLLNKDNSIEAWFTVVLFLWLS